MSRRRGVKPSSTVEDGARADKDAGATSASSGSAASSVAVAALCGLVFGTAINKSGVYSATVLRDQFNFSNYVMLKTFLAATSTSIATISVMHVVPGLRRRVKATEDAYRESIGLPATLAGALILGVGMTVGGACPGTVWAQMGSGSAVSLLTLAGGMTAGAVHGVFAKQLSPLTSAKPIERGKASMVDLVSPGIPRVVLGLGMAAVMAGMVAGIDRFLDTPMPLLPASPWWKQGTWSPVLCGMMIGSLQLPLTWSLSKNVGSASTMQTLASVFFFTNRFPQLNKMRSGMNRWWQVIYLACATGASAAAMTLAQKPWYTGSDIKPLHAYVGGFLIIFGSRIAGGCTSGHGISGAGHLMWRSFGAICAMFAGAIGARYALASVL